MVEEEELEKEAGGWWEETRPRAVPLTFTVEGGRDVAAALEMACEMADTTTTTTTDGCFGEVCTTR